MSMVMSMVIGWLVSLIMPRERNQTSQGLKEKGLGTHYIDPGRAGADQQ